MRVGFISRWDVTDRSALSGMPASTYGALERAGIELIRLDPTPRPSGWKQFSKSAARALLPKRQRSNARKLGGQVRRTLDGAVGYQRLMRRATTLSRRVQDLASRQRLDALFGICISTELYALETDLPIVYASDATARLVNSTYQSRQGLSAGCHRALDEIEQTSLRRAHAVLLAAESTRASVIEHYGIPERVALLAPMGANLVPCEPIRATDVQPPSREGLELLVVAADPLRKRVDLCVDVVEILVRRGIRATLHVVGPPTKRASDSPCTVTHGRLDQSETKHQARHAALMTRAHLMLLPSEAEMYGIAPVEAAHFGKPSLVSDVGGLRTVVVDGESGLLLPADASASQYADEIQAVCGDPGRYMALSRGALRRAHETLNWDAWARTAVSALERAVDRRLSSVPSCEPQRAARANAAGHQALE